jgi:hypothetical protein
MKRRAEPSEFPAVRPLAANGQILALGLHGSIDNCGPSTIRFLRRAVAARIKDWEGEET